MTFACLALFSFPSFAQRVGEKRNTHDLEIKNTDVRIVDAPEEEGLYLYVRKKPYVESIMLTESAELPDNSIATYALRTFAYHPENGNERRILNGEFIETKQKEERFILDSTEKYDEEWESAFVLFVPYKMHFGYRETRRGEIDLRMRGSYVSIRAFSEPYANYEGAFNDNSFFIRRERELSPPNDRIHEEQEVSEADEEKVKEDPPKEITDDSTVRSPAVVEVKPPVEKDVKRESPPEKKKSTYSAEAFRAFDTIARKSGTYRRTVPRGKSLSRVIEDELAAFPRDETLDLVIVLDDTQSMHDVISQVKWELVQVLSDVLLHIPSRVGFVFFRDINDEYVTRRIDFMTDWRDVKKNIDVLRPHGGGDWPEELYAGLSVAINEFDWDAHNKVVLVIGDAPPHHPSRVAVDVEKIHDSAQKKGIIVIPIVLPHS